MQVDAKFVDDMKSDTIIIDGEKLSYELRTPDPNNGYVVFLHGAGTANMDRYSQLAEEVAEQGVNTLTFDFSGHGRSSGLLAELSLVRRKNQATEIISSLCDLSKPITLAGFSMSGQTVCDIVSSGMFNINSIFLGCPAAYRPDVADLPFGNPEFTRRIREEGTWSASTAFQAVADFPGQITFLVPSADKVIPTAVTETFLAKSSEPKDVVALDGCPHLIAAWLQDNPEYRRRIVALLTRSVLTS